MTREGKGGRASAVSDKEHSQIVAFLSEREKPKTLGRDSRCPGSGDVTGAMNTSWTLGIVTWQGRTSLTRRVRRALV
jgi:hypothetical protein